MALDELKEGRQMRYGYNETNSGTFGTPASDSDTFTRIACEHFNMDPDLQGHDIPGAHGTRNVVHANTFTTAYGSMPKFSVSGPVSIFEVDEYFYAHTQKVIEGATPFTKNFTFFSTHPGFDNDEGHFLTWAEGYPVATTSWKMTSCICTRLKLSCERHEFMQFESEWIGVAVTKNSAVYESGTWEFGLDGPGGSDAKTSEYGFLHFDKIKRIEIDFDDVISPIGDKVILHAFEFETAYDLTDGISPDGVGSFEAIALALRGGTFKIEILKDAYSEACLANVSGNSSITITIGWGDADALVQGEMEFIVKGKIAPDGITTDKEGIVRSVIAGTISGANDSSDEPYIVNLSNGIDRSWPAS